MKKLATFCLLFSLSLSAQEAARLDEGPEREVLFYNSELSGMIFKMAEEIQSGKQEERNFKKAVFEIGGGAVATVGGLAIFKKHLGKALVAGGLISVVKGMIDNPGLFRTSMSRLQSALKESQSIQSLRKELVGSSYYNYEVWRLVDDLVDDMINGIDLGYSAKRRCQKFVPKYEKERDIKARKISAEECEETVLKALAESDDLGRRHQPPPEPAANHEAPPQ